MPATATTAAPAASNGTLPTTTNNNNTGTKKSATTPEKKYICVHCGRGFSRSEHRSRHERSRTYQSQLFSFLLGGRYFFESFWVAVSMVGEENGEEWGTEEQQQQLLQQPLKRFQRALLEMELDHIILTLILTQDVALAVDFDCRLLTFYLWFDRYQGATIQMSKMSKHFRSSRSFIKTWSYCTCKGWWYTFVKWSKEKE